MMNEKLTLKKIDYLVIFIKLFIVQLSKKEEEKKKRER